MSDLEQSFKDVGCSRLYFKALAPKQDNDKNQIYLGADESLLHSWPGSTQYRSASVSRAKRVSRLGQPKLQHTLDFWWLWPSRPAAHAPHTRLINYFQYPEIRLSGFIRDCEAPPDALRRTRLTAYGKRWLIIGISGVRVYGAVVESNSFVDIATLERIAGNSSGIVSQHLPSQPRITPTSRQDLLLRKIRGVCRRWHQSQTLVEGEQTARPFRGSQGAGYTLESLLEISRNSRPEPDMLGFEVKSFSGGPVSLITTEADQGVRADAGFDAFMDQYGVPDDADPDVRRFVGRHSTRSINPQTGLRLRIANWDADIGRPIGSAPPVIELFDEQRNAIAAGWSINHLSNKWAAKHANAMYVRSDSRRDASGPHPTHYWYGPDAIVAKGTDILRFFRAVSIGEIFLDPGDVHRRQGTSRRRTQWRIRSGTTPSFARRLGPLYQSVGIATL
jgi:hypothetical protein